MAVKRVKAKVKGKDAEGVYQRFSEKHGIGYDIVYRHKGRQIWERVGWEKNGYTPDMAAIIRSERLRSIRHGEELPQEKKTPLFGDVSKKFLEWSKGNLRSYAQDENRYRLHLKSRFSKKRMNEISSFTLEKLKLELKDELSPQSIKHVLRLMGRIYTKAREWGLFAGESPIKTVKMPRVQNERTRYLTPEEVQRLLGKLKKNPWTKKPKELEDPVLHDIVLVSLLTGARAGEVFSLRGRDVNLMEGIVTFIDTKNGSSRHVPMPDTLRNVLKARMPANLSDYIFNSKKGGKIKEVSHAFDRNIDKLGFNAGVTDARCHLAH